MTAARRLKTLSSIYWVIGGLVVVHSAVMLGVFGHNSLRHASISSVAPGLALGALVAAGISFLFLYPAYCLTVRRHRMACVVCVCVLLLGFPVGTFLGAYTLFMLTEPSIRNAFNALT